MYINITLDSADQPIVLSFLQGEAGIECVEDARGSLVVFLTDGQETLFTGADDLCEYIKNELMLTSPDSISIKEIEYVEHA